MESAIFIFLVITGIAAQTYMDHHSDHPHARIETLGEIIWLCFAVFSPAHWLFYALRHLVRIPIGRSHR